MADKKVRLGKGLESLIPTFDAKAEGQLIEEIPVDAVSPNPSQPRTEFAEEELNELASSIKEHGVIQPIVVVKRGGVYELISGERRVRASKLAGIASVPAIVRNAGEQERLELAVVENVQRSDLSALELCYVYKRMIDDFGMTQDEIAAKVGKSRSSVANCLRLSGLPESVKKALLTGIITEGHARVILSVPEGNRFAFFEFIMAESLSVRESEKRASGFNPVKELPGKSAKKELPVSTDEAKAMGELQDYLGAKVTLSKTAKGGKLTIEYYSDEELTRILEKIRG